MTEKLIKAACVFIVVVILIANIFRFWKLESIPYGLHVDEAASAVTIQCMHQCMSDAEVKPWPLFGFMQYGTDKPPTYIYIGQLWAKVFGTTVGSLRGLSSFVLIIGFIGLYFLVSRLFGRRAALFTVLAATCSSWAWVSGRVAFESFFAPVFVIWGLYFILRSSRWFDWGIAAVMFVMAMYSYPPARMQVPLMLGTLFIFLAMKKQLQWKSFVSFIGVSIILLIPLCLTYIHGALQRRFQEISIFNPTYLQGLGVTGSWWDVWGVFWHNYALHLSPDFLFLTGDPSHVHSIRHMGTLSYLDILALVLFVGILGWSLIKGRFLDHSLIKEKGWVILLWVNILIGIIPAALTNQELPHALRICGAWPFMMILTGLILEHACRQYKVLWVPIVLVGTLSAYLLVHQYFNRYATESKGMFNYWIQDQVNQIKTDDDMKGFLVMHYRKNYHERYYLVQKFGMSCKEANDFWWKLFYQLKDQ